MKGDLYHIFNRGVEKRKICLDNKDRIRFVHNLGDFNSIHNAEQSYFRRRIDNPTDVGRPSEQDKIVDVICWALMPSHPHMMVSEKKKDGVSNFSKKIFGGYTKYFNERNNRSGVLFQGRSKKILVNKDAQLLYLPVYIHLNPLDLFQPKWKEKGIKDVKGAIKFLEEYRWSNYRDIIGKGGGEFADVSNRELFFEIFKTSGEEYKKEMEGWIKSERYLTDVRRPSNIIL